MKVFICWSGDQSKQVAEAFADWIPRVIQKVDTWISAKDISKGADWLAELKKELKETDFGLVCLTPENVKSPWLHYEAGSLAKDIDSAKVMTLLYQLDVSALEGPLKHFQATFYEQEDVLKLLQSINESLGPEGLDGRLLEDEFRLKWPILKKMIERVPEAEVVVPKKSTDEKLDELIASIRRIESMEAGSSRHEPEESLPTWLFESLKPNSIDERLIQLLQAFLQEPIDSRTQIRMVQAASTVPSLFVSDIYDLLRKVHPKNSKRAANSVKNLFTSDDPISSAKMNNIVTALSDMARP